MSARGRLRMAVRSAVVVQSIARGRSGRVTSVRIAAAQAAKVAAADRMDAELAGATMIQSVARQRAAHLMLQHALAATVLMQAQARGRFGRTAAQLLRVEKVAVERAVAATTLQAARRGHAARMLAGQRQMDMDAKANAAKAEVAQAAAEMAAATYIESRVRAHVARREVHALLCARRDV